MSTLAEFHESDLTEGESETGGDQYQESCAIHFISKTPSLKICVIGQIQPSLYVNQPGNCSQILHLIKFIVRRCG